MALATAVGLNTVMDQYDSELSYEERAKIRKQKRQTVKDNSDVRLKLTSSVSTYQSSTPSNHSSSSPSPSPVFSPVSNSIPSSRILQNGDTHRPKSHVVNNSPSVNQSQIAPRFSKGQSTVQSSGMDRRRYRSTPPEDVVTTSGWGTRPTPTQVPLADTRVHPVVGDTGHPGKGYSRPRFHSDDEILSHKKKPPPYLTHASTVANFERPASPQSPHSPLAISLASRHLTGLLRRQQERERSVSPSPNLSKTNSKMFSFPSPDRDIDNGSNVTSTSGGTESTLTPQNAAHKSARIQTHHSEPSKDSFVPHPVTDLTPTYGEYGTMMSDDSAFSELPGEEPDGGKISKGGHVLNSNSFTFENFEGFSSNQNSAGRNSNNQHSFAENLKFVDSSSDSQYGSMPPSADKPVNKAQVVYRPIDVMNVDDITMIPGSGFFDASQSQVDAQVDFGLPPLTFNEPVASSEKGSKKKGVRSKDKSKEGKKSSKSGFRLLRKHSSTKTIEETNESEDVLGDGDETPKLKHKFTKKEKESKKSSPKLRSSSESMLMQRNQSSSTSKSPPPIDSSLSPSAVTGKPPLPNLTPKKTKLKQGSSSFRDIHREKSPDSSGLSKISMPDLASPTRRSRNSTPDSNLSSGSDTKLSGKQEKPSLRKRISQSLRDLVGKENPGGTSKSSWKFTDDIGTSESPVALRKFKHLDESPPELTTAINQVSSLTEVDRNSLHEDTEFIPRTHSMEGLRPKYEERAIDVVSYPENNRSAFQGGAILNDSDTHSLSSSEYHTASDSEMDASESHTGLASSSIQLLNSPTGDSSQDFGYAPRRKSVTDILDSPKQTSSEINIATSSSSSSDPKSELSSQTLQGKVISGKGLRQPASSTTSKSKTSATDQKPKSKDEKSKLPLSKGSAISTKKAASPSSSPRSSQKLTTKPSSPVIGKKEVSPLTSPRSSQRMGSKAMGKAGSKSLLSQMSKHSAKTASPSASPQRLSKQVSSSSAIKSPSPLSSPRSSQRLLSRDTYKKTVSPSASPRSSHRLSKQGSSSSAVKSPSPSSSPRSSQRLLSRDTYKKTASPSASPQRLSKQVSLSSAIKSPSPLSSPRSSQRLLSRDTNKKTASPTASPRSSQRLSKTGTTLSSPSKSSPKASPVALKKATQLSPTSSPLAGRKVTPVKTSPARNSPLLKRKQSPAVTVSKSSPPKLSKTPLESSCENDDSSDSFSRFTRGRTPIKMRSSVTKESNETLADRVKRIKEHRKSESHSLRIASTSNKDPVSPSTTRRATTYFGGKQLPSLSLAASTPRSPDKSNPTTPIMKGKKRRVGVSQETAPSIDPIILEETTALSKSTEVMNDLVSKTAADLSMDVDLLLSAVGEKLDLFSVSPGQSGSDTGSSSLLNSLQTETGISELETSTSHEASTKAPAIASMEVNVFNPTPIHSRDSSIDIDTFLEQARAQEMPESSGSPTISPKHHPDTTSSKKKVSEKPGAKEDKMSSLPPGSTKKDKKKSPGIFRKKTSAPANVPSKMSKGATTSASNFTSSLPPRPPTLSREPSAPSISHSKPSTSDSKISSTGINRPRTVVVGQVSSSTGSQLRSSMRKSTPAKSIAGPSSTLQSKSTTNLDVGGTNSLKGRSGLRASSRTKKSSLSAHTTPLHGVKSTGARTKESSFLNRTGDKSLRSKSSTNIRPGSAATSPRRGSLTSLGSGLSQDSSMRRTSTLVSPSRRSMKRANSGEILPRKIKPGASSTLTREHRASHGSGGVYGSMRKSGRFSTTVRPKSSGLARSANTMSMRIPRTNSASVRKVSTPAKTSTLSRTSAKTSTLSRKSVSTSSVGSNSPSRSGTMKRTNSGTEVFAAFDHISSQAQGSMLSSSDHRRMVRPKLRSKASTSHLRMLQQRSDVSTEMTSISDSTALEGGLDSNTYSTYMAKKNLAPSAMAGLAIKLDLGTVKLRKTGIVEQMLSDKAGRSLDNPPVSPNPALGLEYNTKHPVMLLQIKGRRHIQTRLVEPCGASLNSGDVFVALSDKTLVHWIGKSANVIEKARGSDVVMRILHKKELGCHAKSAVVLKEEERTTNEKKINVFWELLGGKKGVKSSESVPSDEVHEKAVNLATMVYQLEGEGNMAQFVPFYEHTSQMVKVALLNTKRILLFDFYGEVYVWVGKRSPGSLRKKAVELGKKIYDVGCRPPMFNLRSSPARASGRYRPRSSVRSPRHSVLNASGRRTSKGKSDLQKRPEWALFARLTEGTESILFREKFADWPEPGRIIKMKGHVSSGEVQVTPMISVELKPADVEKMVKPTPAFEGLRLEGENVHRGQGNFKVSRSTFACNRVRPMSITKWVVREFDNVEIPQQDNGLFYSCESYVIRWTYRITVVRELEGIVPGQGPFAQDRQYRRDKAVEKERASPPADTKKEQKNAPKKEGTLSDESDVEENDEESRRILETGGRDKVAYFFWQGDQSSVNEKGASALMTIELDKEKGPQVRVLEGKEHPTFLNLFSGGMILFEGRSQTHSLEALRKQCRVFCVRGQARSEAHLLEITPENENEPLSACLRSRGCFVFYHRLAQNIYLWHGSKATLSLKKCAHSAAKLLRNRLSDVKLISVHEGEETNDFCALIGDKSHYHSMLEESRKHTYTPRLFELTSTTGEFIASEVIYPARSSETVAFPFLQSDLYSSVQPAIFLVDAFYEVYVWLGWWPQVKNKLLREANATTGSAHSKWLRDKKLALETAELYTKACDRIRTPRAYMVTAGLEHEKFINLFPSWQVSSAVQEINCKDVQKPSPRRIDVDCELLKYSRNRFKLEELKKRPLPEGVDPAMLETYLSDSDFQEIFKTTKEQFTTLPPWKQAKLKKAVGLY